MNWGHPVGKIVVALGACVALDGCARLAQSEIDISSHEDLTGVHSGDSLAVREPDSASSTPSKTAVRIPSSELSPDNLHKNSDAGSAAPATDLWDRLRSRFSLLPQFNHTHHARALSGQFWFGLQQVYINQIVRRARPYLFHIVEELEKRGMPGEIALLPIVESQYQPHALSPVNAAGIWQMIPATGKRFGLKQNPWYDGRRDVVASTEAALAYLQFLHTRFHGDWLHALAAYNCGEGLVDAAIENNRAHHQPTDFWSLHLPAETKRYIPRLLAIARVINEPERFNLTLDTIDNNRYLSEVTVKGQVKLDRFATLAGLDVEQLRNLNPGFSGNTTIPRSDARLVIPAANVGQLRHKLAQLPPAVRRVTKLELTPETEVETNGALTNHGDRFLAAVSQPRTDFSAPAGQAPYKDPRAAITGPGVDSKRRPYGAIASGATFNSADALPVKSLRDATLLPATADWSNKYLDEELIPGSTYRGGDSAGGRLMRTNLATRDRSESDFASSARYVRYRVREGDSLWRISQHFRVTVEQIRRWNTLARSQISLTPGHVLHIYANGGSI